MKAVVLEVRDGLAAVLREDGTVEKLRRDCRVGETIELEEENRVLRMPRKTARWAAAAAAALVIVSAGGGYGYNNAYAYSYVTLDANPSIEYVLNRKNKVIAVEALNEDAEGIVAELSGAGSTLTDAMAETTALLYAGDYLSGEDDSILVNVTSRGENQRESLTQEVDAYFSACEEAGEDLTVYVTNATREELKAAESLGISAGRYVVMRDIEQSGGRLSEEAAGRAGQTPVDQLLEDAGRREPRQQSGPEGPGGMEQPPDMDGLPGDVPGGERPGELPAREDGAGSESRPAGETPAEGPGEAGPLGGEGGPAAPDGGASGEPR